MKIILYRKSWFNISNEKLKSKAFKLEKQLTSLVSALIKTLYSAIIIILKLLRHIQVLKLLKTRRKNKPNTLIKYVLIHQDHKPTKITLALEADVFV